METLINKAVSKLEDKFILIDEYIWVEKTHMGNLVRGGTFRSFDEGTGDISLVHFSSFKDYAEFHGFKTFYQLLCEIDANSEIVCSIAKEGQFFGVYDAYNDKAYKCNDLNDVYYRFKECLTDGKGVSIYTKDEALNILKDEKEHKYYDVYTLAKFIVNNL